MILKKSIWTGVLFAVLVTLGNGTAQAVDQVVAHGTISRSSTMAAGTPGFEAVRQFVIQHSLTDQHMSLSNAGNLPVSFHITSTTLIREPNDLVRTQDMAYPPVSLPANGNPGDTLSISSCSNHISETWTYTWGQTSSGGQGWVMQKYTWSVVNKCKDMTTQ